MLGVSSVNEINADLRFHPESDAVDERRLIVIAVSRLDGSEEVDVLTGFFLPRANSQAPVQSVHDDGQDEWFGPKDDFDFCVIRPDRHLETKWGTFGGELLEEPVCAFERERVEKTQDLG
jgi:hypothetical protein